MLIVRKGNIGLGVFHSIPLYKGDLIVDWSKHPLFQKPPRIPPEWKFQRQPDGSFCGPVGPDQYPDAYFNHSCQPNAAILRDGSLVHLRATKNISPDEEITFDYATLYGAPWSMKCRCGTPTCRGVIFGESAQPIS